MLNFSHRSCQTVTSGIRLTWEQKPRISYRAVFPSLPCQGTHIFQRAISRQCEKLKTPLILFILKCWFRVGQHYLCPDISWSQWLTPLHKIAAGMKANTSLKFSLQSKQQLLFLLRMAHIF